MSNREIEIHLSHGVDLMERLQERTLRKNRWKPGAWKIIVDALNDEAQFMREGQVGAVCSYTFIAFLCVRYLQDNPDMLRATELCKYLRRDIGALSAHLAGMKDGELAKNEVELLGLSVEGLNEVTTGLSKTNPGTL